MASKFIFRSIVYRGGSVLNNACQCLLNQTYSNFIWYILDLSGNKENKDIIDQYADKRFFHIDLYGSYTYKTMLPSTYLDEILESNSSEDIFATLDIDDVYQPQFCEKMLDYMLQYELDIGICSSAFIDAHTSKVIGVRKPQQAVILRDQETFDKHFLFYYQFMRTIWGKVFKLHCLRKCKHEKEKQIYGNDTLFTMEAFRNASRVGIFPDILHEYNMSRNTSSHKFDPIRIFSDSIVYEAALNYLQSKCGYVSQDNINFIRAIYSHAIGDSLDVVRGSDLSFAEKILYTKEILNQEKTKEIFNSHNAYGNILNERIRLPIVKWLFERREHRNPDGAKIAAEIIFTMYPDLPVQITQDDFEYLFLKKPEIIKPMLAKNYNEFLKQLQICLEKYNTDIPSLTKLEFDIAVALKRRDEELFLLFINVKKRSPNSFEILKLDTEIHDLFQKYPLLQDLNTNLGVLFSSAICKVMNGDYISALNSFLSIRDLEINDEEAEAYIIFGQNLSAAAENADAYIYFKKVWIAYLLDCSQVEEAGKELEEFKKMLPEDEDFIELQNRFEQIKP